MNINNGIRKLKILNISNQILELIKILKKFSATKIWWMDEWVDGWEGAKAGLKIAYSNQLLWLTENMCFVLFVYLFTFSKKEMKLF